MNLTLNSHLKYYIGGRLFGHRKTPYEKYTVECGRIDMDHYKKSSWLIEQYRIADLVYKDLGKDFIVMFSGGTDSEIVLRAFKHIGVNVRPLFVKFIGDYNLDEYYAARKVTDALGLKLEVVPFDVKGFFWSGKAPALAAELQSHQIGSLVLYQSIINLQTPVVMGGSFTLLREPHETAGSKWFYNSTEAEDSASIRCSHKYNMPIIQEWFAYTPEVIGYFLDHPKIKWLISDRYNYKTWSDGIKNEIFMEWMPEIIKKTKKTGYETLMGFTIDTNMDMRQEFPARLETSLDGIYVDDLFRQLFGDEQCQ
jgi:hypothetical protein